MAKREYFYFPDMGDAYHWGVRHVVDPARGELIFPVFSDEEKARAWITDKEIQRIWRQTWKQCEKHARRHNCVGLIVDPPPMVGDRDDNLMRDKIQYLENPKTSDA